MCGICGKINFNSEPIDSKLIHSMAEVLNHRGPDDMGVYVNGNVGLGHKRLSIIDLSGEARQPMSNEDSSIWIVYNGEIYNFQELKKTLEEKGHIFRSRSDTEVIIHLYEDSGIECVKLLRGMFAFAIWDENKKRLFLARDRIGKKPLNYAVKNDFLIFASEIKSILEDPDIKREVNSDSLHHYLTYQYVPHPETMFMGIKKLLPGHILVWEQGKIKIEQYWSLSYKDKVKLTEEECSERLLELLTEATKIRLISDVPLGAFLSGGIDSSAIVAIMSKISNKPVKTFSIGFKEKSFNELKYAKTIAKLFNTEHREYIVEPDCLEVLPKLIWHFDEPFADSSSIAVYYLARMTHQEVTVALNGDGGDESFAGYKRYAMNKMANIYSLAPLFIRNTITGFIKGFPESTAKNGFIKNFKRFVKGTNFSKENRYGYWMSIFDNESKNNLYSEYFKNRLANTNSWDYIAENYRKCDVIDLLDSTLFVDVMTYLPCDLLTKVDITSMANSLECRSPFLDHKLMEFCASIPSNLKLKGITTKYILKKALKKILPSGILQRKKAGFGVPVGSWFRNELKRYGYETLLSQKSIERGYFDKDALKRLLDEHCSGKIDHGHRIWALVNLELWHQMFIDGGEFK